MLIKWSESAERDMAEIFAYFMARDEEEVARALVARILKAARRLETSPLSGRPGRIRGTREIVILKAPYILVYELPAPNVAEIVRVIHTARLWPDSL